MCLQYDGCFLFCTYSKNSTEQLPHDHAALMGSVGRGGYLEVEVGPNKFVAYTEEEPVKVRLHSTTRRKSWWR